MSFYFREMPESRSGTTNPPTEERTYIAFGSNDSDYIKAIAIASTPGSILTLNGTIYRQNIDVKPGRGSYATVSVSYAKNESEEGSFTWSFDTTGGTITMKVALSHIASYPAAGAPDHGGAIGVNGDEVDGVEVVIPAMKISATYTHPAGAITIAQAKSLARNTGRVNNDTFLTFAAGEVLYLGATGSDGSDAAATVSYQFACSENLQNEVIGGITVTEKQGWDVTWVQFKSDVDGGLPIRPPEWIHVDRVYKRINMAGLVGFG